MFRDCFSFLCHRGIKTKKNKPRSLALDTLLNSASRAEFVALFVCTASWLTPKCHCYSRGAQRETIKTTGLILIYRQLAKKLNWAAQYWKEQKCIIWPSDLIRYLWRKNWRCHFTCLSNCKHQCTYERTQCPPRAENKTKKKTFLCRPAFFLLFCSVGMIILTHPIYMHTLQTLSIYQYNVLLHTNSLYVI